MPRPPSVTTEEFERAMRDLRTACETAGVPFGFCLCGCDEKTTVATMTSRADAVIMGVPLRWKRGHNCNLKDRPKLHQRIAASEAQGIMLGWCQCGCGRQTDVSKITSRTYGYRKGIPYRYNSYK